jgi:predicted metal-dependent HD superfamily phosphohydrolase
MSSPALPNGIYQLSTELNPQQITDAIDACLAKAEALAVTAATIDFDAYTTDIISNYLWAVSDIIREARWLCERGR